MMNSTINDVAHKTTRLALQSKLKGHVAIKSNLDRARQELEMAQSLVDSHQRTTGFLDAFAAAFQAAAVAFNDLTSVVPGLLVNGCLDRELRDEHEVSMSVRRESIADHSHARSALKQAEQGLSSTKTRIALQRGEPSILKPGELPPWDAGVIARTFSRLQISFGVEIASWALSADLQNIAFSPSVDAGNARHYSEMWNSDLRDIKLATAALTRTASRLADADEALKDIKHKLIWSVV